MYIFNIFVFMRKKYNKYKQSWPRIPAFAYLCPHLIPYYYKLLKITFKTILQ